MTHKKAYNKIDKFETSNSPCNQAFSFVCRGILQAPFQFFRYRTALRHNLHEPLSQVKQKYAMRKKQGNE